MNGWHAWSLAVVGLVSLALSMHRHHRALFGTALSRCRWKILALTGWLLLGASFAPAIAEWGAAVGLVAWFGILTAAALVVVAGLAYAAHIKGSVQRR